MLLAEDFRRHAQLDLTCLRSRRAADAMLCSSLSQPCELLLLENFQTPLNFGRLDRFHVGFDHA